jgi:hypothetical protein
MLSDSRASSSAQNINLSGIQEISSGQQRLGHLPLEGGVASILGQATALGPAAVPLPNLPSAMPIYVGRRMTLRRLNLAKAIPTRACCHPSSEVLPLPTTDKPNQ